MTADSASRPQAGLSYGEPAGRWVLTATVLGSSVAFLDATVVNIALPTIGRDLETGATGLTWTILPLAAGRCSTQPGCSPVGVAARRSGARIRFRA